MQDNSCTLETKDRLLQSLPQAPAGHSELEPLNLSATEITQLIAFLKTLSTPLATPPEWLNPPN